jgi:hypothetical protein
MDMEAVFIIRRDGVEITREKDSAVLGWFLRHQSQSMHWALKWEGYSIEQEKSHV